MVTVRRSALFVPGHRKDLVPKALLSGPDAIIIDLEDAVPSHLLQLAFDNVCNVLTSLEWGAIDACVRVSDSSKAGLAQAKILATECKVLSSIVLPKVENAETVELFSLELDSAGAGDHLGIEALIETARGVVAVDEIALAKGRLTALAFGPGDYAASVGSTQLAIGGANDLYPGDIWHYPRSRILVAARAAGLEAMDGPHGAVADLDGCRRQAQWGRALGYTGKWAIHPSQVAVINEVFSPTEADIMHAKRILELFEGGQADLGVANLAGQMVDAVTLRHAQGIVALAESISCRSPNSTDPHGRGS
jgi:citrate lyase beta subunit